MQVKKNIQVTAQLKNQYSQQAAAANKVTAATKKQTSAMSGLHGMMIRMAGVMSARAMVSYGKDAVMVAADLEAMQTAMNFATGSTVQGINTMITAKRVSQEYGLALLPAIEGLTKLSAASKGTALEGKPAVDLFKGISKAIAVLGLNSERSHGTFMAFEQIMSKGKVSAEELRRQLGDRIPGAFQIAARAMNVSTSELDKMLRSGSLLSEDFLPRMAAQMEKEFSGGIDKASKTTRASLNRLDNTMLEIKDTMGRELFPAIDIVTVALEDFSDIVDWTIQLSKDSPTAFKAMTVGLGTIAGAATAAMFGINPLVGGITALAAAMYALDAAGDQTTQAMRDFRMSAGFHKNLLEGQESLEHDFGLLKTGDMDKETFGERARAQLQGINENIEAMEEATKLLNREQLKGRLKEIKDDTWMSWASDTGEEIYGVSSSDDYVHEIDKIEEQLDQLNELDKARKEAQLMRMKIKGMGGVAGLDLENDPSAGLDEVATGTATVNGSGNRIMNITIGNVVENLTNEFREGDIEQQEAESERQIDMFARGLLGVFNDLKQIQQ